MYKKLLLSVAFIALVGPAYATIPPTGPLAFSTIQGEFGGANPISLSEYYAGGSYVPSGTSGINGPVPSSGTMEVSKFRGTTAFTPVTHQYTSGSGNETIPTGATSCTITVIGPGATGGNQQNDGSNFASGGGGGGGARAISICVVASGDWLGTLAYVVGTNSATNSTVNGTLNSTSVAITAQHGSIGGDAPNQFSGGSGGTRGSASGGNQSNTDGGDGSPGSASTGSEPGGAGGTGFGIYAVGGAGADSPGSSNSGLGGFIEFAWT